MDAIAYARYQRAGTRKVAQVLKLVRGKPVLQVQQILPMVSKGVVPIIAKTIQSAAANLTNKASREGKTLVPTTVAGPCNSTAETDHVDIHWTPFITKSDQIAKG